MKKVFFGMLVGFAVTQLSTAALAVNCDQVRRYAKTGRTAQEISETMVVDQAEIQKCLDEPAKEPAAPTPAAGTSK